MSEVSRKSLAFCTFSLFIAGSFCLITTNQRDTNLVQFLNLDGIKEVLHLAKWSQNFTKTPHRSALALEAFSWKSCGTPDDGFQIDSLSISPDPIKAGAPLKVTAAGHLKVDLDSPFEVDVVVEKKIIVWITLPCMDELGSCNYSDVCGRLPPPPCPIPFQQSKLPCNCPFPMGSYNVNDLQIEIDQTKFPEWLTEGEFKVHVVLKKSGQQVGCYDFQMKIVGTN